MSGCLAMSSTGTVTIAAVAHRPPVGGTDDWERARRRASNRTVAILQKSDGWPPKPPMPIQLRAPPASWPKNVTAATAATATR